MNTCKTDKNGDIGEFSKGGTQTKLRKLPQSAQSFHLKIYKQFNGLNSEFPDKISHGLKPKTHFF